MGLNKHRCVLPRLWNSIHMFPFDPCYCSRWNTNPSDIPTTTWLGLPRGQRETLMPVCIHALVFARVCFCVCVCSVWFGQSLQHTRSSSVRTLLVEGGALWTSSGGPSGWDGPDGWGGVYFSSCSALESLWQHRFNSSRLADGCGWHHPVNLW